MRPTLRKIVHIDMDAFFASVEQMDHPQYRGKPVVVGGQPETRGVVAAASYEARKFGIHSAMSSYRAALLCKDLIFIKPRINRYRELSQQIHSIFNHYTYCVEPLSMDEAYLDVSSVKKHKGSATLIAQAIKHDILKKTGLTASAGVSYNKFLAKLASDMDKPNGLYVIEPNNVQALIQDLPVNKIFGVGNVTHQKMQKLHLYTIGDLQRFGNVLLKQHFGKQGTFFYNVSVGIDHREVQVDRIRKSVGREKTFLDDTSDIPVIEKEISRLLQEVIQRLHAHKLQARTIALKIKYHNFKSISRRITMHRPFENHNEMYAALLQLLQKTQAGQVPIRLLGVHMSNLETMQVAVQAALF